MVLARRSCLSVPGSSERMLAKARTLPVDEVVIDLEDSVSPEMKEEARARAALALETWEGPAVAVRINPLSSAWGKEDVAAVSGADSLVVPKVEAPSTLAEVDELLGSAGTGLQALIETAAGVVRAGEITRASPRLETLITGYADLAASLGQPLDADYPGDRWHSVRMTVLV